MTWPPSLELSDLRALDDRLLHVFVVGPGEGEAIAIALPAQSGWLLADGCKSGAGESGLVEVLHRYRRGDEPILVYVLTHPHLDHARGVVELCETFGDAVRMIGLTQPEAARPSAVTSKRIVARQVERALAALKKLPARRVELAIGASLPLADLVTARVLSPPTDHAMADVNDASAAIVIQSGAARVLLGSDLPTETPSDSGWRAILSADPATSDAVVLKVPHHGSKTSHYEGLFPRHQEERAWIATPFNGNHLPDLVDMSGLHWILERGSPMHLTAPPVSKHAQLPIAHPGRLSLASLRSRVQVKPTGIPLLDIGAVETTPRAIHVRDSLWCFALDDAGKLVGRWRGSAAVEVAP